MTDPNLRWAEVLAWYAERGIELTPQMLRILRGSQGATATAATAATASVHPSVLSSAKFESETT